MKKVLIPVVLGALLVVLMLGLVAAAPNPATDNVRVITLANAAAIAADTTYGPYIWLSNVENYGFDEAEFFYVIDQGTTANTMTLKLQVSPDNSTWVAHTTGNIVADNSADATSYAAYTVDGRYFRVVADVSNTETVTVTVKAVIH